MPLLARHAISHRRGSLPGRGIRAAIFAANRKLWLRGSRGARPGLLSERPASSPHTNRLNRRPTARYHATGQTASDDDPPRRKNFRYGVRGAEAAHPHQAGRQARPDPRRRAGRRRAAPRNPPGRRAPVRHRRHAAQPQRARAADRGSARRNVRLRPARDAAQGPDDQRYPDQRPEEHVRRTPRQAGKDRRHSSATTST